jgi:hypothetical protein
MSNTTISRCYHNILYDHSVLFVLILHCVCFNPPFHSQIVQTPSSSCTDWMWTAYQHEVARQDVQILYKNHGRAQQHEVAGHNGSPGPGTSQDSPGNHGSPGYCVMHHLDFNIFSELCLNVHLLNWKLTYLPAPLNLYEWCDLMNYRSGNRHPHPPLLLNHAPLSYAQCIYLQ